MAEIPIDLEPGDSIIVLKADGSMQYWHQAFPELIADLSITVESTESTCDCEHDQCPAHEMPGWNRHLLDRQ